MTPRPSILLLALALLPALSCAQTTTPPPAGVAISQATLDELAGNYRTAQGIPLRVWREGTTLKVQAEGQAAWSLVAESESSFVVPGLDARISFGFDAAGKPGYLILRQDGRDTKAIRD
ncbi:MAG TPA: hypothetical protein VFF96_09140 [Pseudoxanthomonas sp.]|nr:hypothetical protein [Pseudoxanthomonas sp.]